MELETKKGIITGINPKRYFGFIRDENGDEFFFHATGVVSPTDFTKLKAGLNVEFLDIKDGLGRRRAIKVIVT